MLRKASLAARWLAQASLNRCGQRAYTHVYGGTRIRLATAQDLPSILSGVCDGIYNGHDYIPRMVPHWIAQHEARVEVDGVWLSPTEVYVSEDVDKPGLVTGLEALLYLDNFTTIMYRALRVHKAHHGKGLANLLKRHLEDRITQLPARLNRLRITTGTDNFASLHVHKGLRLTHRYATLGIGISANDGQVLELPIWQQLVAQYHAKSHQVVLVTADQLWDELVVHPFPFISDPLHIQWELRELTQPNLRELQGAGVLYKVTRDPFSGRIQSLSLSAQLENSGGTEFSICVYTQAIEHLLAQIICAVLRCQKNWFALTIHYDVTLAGHVALESVRAATVPYWSTLGVFDEVILEESRKSINERVRARIPATTA
eukprot:m.200355 g.200355  ORF g.200355 m.200355 type:complete len:373 (+) comp53816_c0_seq2:48-1166(+)